RGCAAIPSPPGGDSDGLDDRFGSERDRVAGCHARGSGAAKHRAEGVQGYALAGLDGLEAAEHGLLVFGLELDRRAVVVHEDREARALRELGAGDDLALHDPGASGLHGLQHSTSTENHRRCGAVQAKLASLVAARPWIASSARGGELGTGAAKRA